MGLADFLQALRTKSQSYILYLVSLGVIVLSVIFIIFHLILIIKPSLMIHVKPRNEFISLFIWLLNDILCLINILYYRFHQNQRFTRLRLGMKIYSITFLVLSVISAISHIIVFQSASYGADIIQIILLSLMIWAVFRCRKAEPVSGVPSFDDFLAIDSSQAQISCIAPCCEWTWIIISLVLMILMTLHSTMLCADYCSLSAIGELTSIMSVGDRINKKVKIHMYCTESSNVNKSKPTVVIENGAGSSSIDAINLQNNLTAKGFEVCIYDRPGYGYTKMMNIPEYSGFRHSDDLKAVLDKREKKGPFIIVGHSAGGELAQLFAYRYPDNVSGIVIVDGYPEYIKFVECELNNWDSKAQKSILDSTRNMIRIYEFVSILGLMRIAMMKDKSFTPKEKVNDRYIFQASSLFWTAQKVDYGTGSETTDFLTKLGNEAKNSNLRYGKANGTNSDVMWPSFKNNNMKVLVLPANTTVDSTSKKEIDQKRARLYFDQAHKYAETLPTNPENGKVEICSDFCNHSMIWQNADFIAEKINDFFQ